MAEHAPAVRAAIDIGSNTIHIVVARCSPNTLDILADQLELVRIGESVTATGEISEQKQVAALATLTTYKALAEQHRASPILVVATEAIRQARNSSAFIAAVQRETGLTIQLISGTAEAALTFRGTIYDLPIDLPQQVCVMDLGGGSTELVMATEGHITSSISFPVGSGWLHDRYLPSDPPTSDERTAAKKFLRTYLQGQQLKQRPPVLIATGGSANSLVLLAQQAFGLQEQPRTLSRQILARCEEVLSSITAAEVSTRYGQPTSRARILPAGALIIQAIMELLHVNTLYANEHGIREGVLLTYEQYGEQWLASVQQEPATQAADTPPETFVQFGRRMLLERTKQLLDWCETVQQHESEEAIHKMRVATRRLRAMLDAYAANCDAKAFKVAYRTVKKLADLLGDVRDMDIALQRLQAQMAETSMAEQASKQWLISQLTPYRLYRQSALRKFIDTLDPKTLLLQIERCIPTGGSTHGKS